MTQEQALVLGLIAMGIVQGLKVVLIGLFGLPKPSTLTVALIALAVAVGVAYVWHGPVVLPDPQADPFAFLLALAQAAGAVFAEASVFYYFLLERILKGLDTLAARARLYQRRLLAP